MNVLLESPFFGIALSAIAYCIGVTIQKKVKSPLCNGLIIAGILVIAVLRILSAAVFGILPGFLV